MWALVNVTPLRASASMLGVTACWSPNGPTQSHMSSTAKNITLGLSPADACCTMHVAAANTRHRHILCVEKRRDACECCIVLFNSWTALGMSSASMRPAQTPLWARGRCLSNICSLQEFPRQCANPLQPPNGPPARYVCFIRLRDLQSELPEV